jgi:Lamin Tail Domain/Secretion system C-terminal sorting domain
MNRSSGVIQPDQPLNLAVIDTLIDRTVATISEAAVRENLRWGTEQNLSAEISNMKDWVKQRIDWMTANIGPYSDCSNVETPPLVITKIMYNSNTSATFPLSTDQEFIEIQNIGNKTVDMTGVYFSGTGLVYQFPANSEIFAGSRKILASNSTVFFAKYGIPASGQFTRNLSDTGQKLVLADGFGNVIDSVRYSNLPPWPDADGNGSYLELVDPYSDNSIASNWIASKNTILSVNETETIANLRFYPAPVTDNLTIESSGIIKNVELFDFQGRSLQKIDINSGIHKLDMSPYSRGIYLIRVITSSGNFIQKIIKN